MCDSASYSKRTKMKSENDGNDEEKGRKAMIMMNIDNGVVMCD